jgi:hypothetical protein
MRTNSRRFDKSTSRLAPWLGVILVASALIFVLVYLFPLFPASVDRQILRAKSLDFVGEAYPPDGGSRVFLFELPRHRFFAVMVRHRHPALGGNAAFQEIWVGQNPGFRSHFDLIPGSLVEAKLLKLLRTARCHDVSFGFITRPPQTNALVWLDQRIRDRASTW